MLFNWIPDVKIICLLITFITKQTFIRINEIHRWHVKHIRIFITVEVNWIILLSKIPRLKIPFIKIKIFYVLGKMSEKLKYWIITLRSL